ncbi:hypothetical protein B0H14DRAFT_3867247 [Mycena olivaceomarginata]|nr:hypothetical protein B0H14DRAFT_3867247 [Mycena olivaceomarginata]
MTMTASQTKLQTRSLPIPCLHPRSQRRLRSASRSRASFPSLVWVSVARLTPPRGGLDRSFSGLALCFRKSFSQFYSFFVQYYTYNYILYDQELRTVSSPASISDLAPFVLLLYRNFPRMFSPFYLHLFLLSCSLINGLSPTIS